MSTPTSARGSQVLAVAVSGELASGLGTSKELAHSPPDTRLVVFGSSAFVSDDVLRTAQQLDSTLATANLELVHNAVDWALSDTDLLSIRSHDAASRALTIEVDARDRWRTINHAIAIAGLLLVVGVAWVRRRRVSPLEMT